MSLSEQELSEIGSIGIFLRVIIKNRGTSINSFKKSIRDSENFDQFDLELISMFLDNIILPDSENAELLKKISSMLEMDENELLKFQTLFNEAIGQNPDADTLNASRITQSKVQKIG